MAVGDEPIWEGEEVIERTIDPDGTVHERVVRRLARVDRAPGVGPDEPAAPRSIDLTDAVELEPSPSSVPDAATTSALRAAQDAVTPSPKQSWLANWKVVRSTTLDPAGAATSFRTTAMQVLEGEAELEIVRHLLRLHRGLSRHVEGQPLGPQVDAAQAEVMNIVNNFFYDKMTALPSIRAYVEGLAARSAG